MTHKPVHANPDTSGLSRRHLLAAAGLGLAAPDHISGPAHLAPVSGVAPTPAPLPGAGTTARWPGHQPGRIYLGMSYPGDIDDMQRRLGPIGVHRSFFTWDQDAREDATIRADHAAGRLPWISFKPPGGANGWADITAGRHDTQLRAKATRYAGYTRPVIVTFHHEPNGDDPRPDTPESAWGGAWLHIHNALDTAGALTRVTFAPVMQEWAWNPKNPDGAPDRFLTPAVLNRVPLLGIDCYQNESGHGYETRLGRIRDWLTNHGHPDTMLGLGETAATDDFGTPNAATWWHEQWKWCQDNTNSISVISYFNSSRNSRHDWPLRGATEAAFSQSLTGSVACHL